MGSGERRGVLAATDDGPERGRHRETNQGGRGRTRGGADRHALGGSDMPVAGPGRVQTEHLLVHAAPTRIEWPSRWLLTSVRGSAYGKRSGNGALMTIRGAL